MCEKMQHKEHRVVGNDFLAVEYESVENVLKDGPHEQTSGEYHTFIHKGLRTNVTHYSGHRPPDRWCHPPVGFCKRLTYVTFKEPFRVSALSGNVNVLQINLFGEAFGKELCENGLIQRQEIVPLITLGSTGGFASVAVNMHSSLYSLVDSRRSRHFRSDVSQAAGLDGAHFEFVTPKR